ncbi:uncharacterized protein METZ01_LOCUS176351, partial [marine metagenome]
GRRTRPPRSRPSLFFTLHTIGHRTGRRAQDEWRVDGMLGGGSIRLHRSVEPLDSLLWDLPAMSSIRVEATINCRAHSLCCIRRVEALTSCRMAIESCEG